MTRRKCRRTRTGPRHGPVWITDTRREPIDAGLLSLALLEVVMNLPEDERQQLAAEGKKLAAKSKKKRAS
jgi:hypothetical protein